MKKIAGILASSLLKTTLFSLAIAAAVVAVFGNPSVVKDLLEKSTVYDGIVENALAEAQKNVSADEQVTALNQPEIRAAAEKALPSDELQSSTETVIDSVYRWLNGETPTPDFTIDLSAAKQRLVTAAGDTAEAKFNALPVCTPQQLRTVDSNTDVFSLPCRPPGASSTAARQRVEAEVANNEGFLKDPVLSTESLPKDEQGQTVFERAQGAPTTFQSFKSLPWLLAIFSLVLAAIVFFLSESRRKAVKSLGITFLGSGIFLLITVWLASYLFGRATRPGGSLRNTVSGEFQGSALEVLRLLNNAFGSKILLYSLVYAGLGLALLISLRVWFKQPSVEPVAPDSPQASPPATFT